MDTVDPQTRFPRKYEELKSFVLELQRKDVARKLFTRSRGSNDVDVSGFGHPEHSEE